MTVLLMYPFLFCIFLQIEIVFAKVGTLIPNSATRAEKKKAELVSLIIGQWN